MSRSPQQITPYWISTPSATHLAQSVQNFLHTPEYVPSRWHMHVNTNGATSRRTKPSPHDQQDLNTACFRTFRARAPPPLLRMDMTLVLVALSMASTWSHMYHHRSDRSVFQTSSKSSLTAPRRPRIAGFASHHIPFLQLCDAGSYDVRHFGLRPTCSTRLNRCCGTGGIVYRSP